MRPRHHLPLCLNCRVIRADSLGRCLPRLFLHKHALDKDRRNKDAEPAKSVKKTLSMSKDAPASIASRCKWHKRNRRNIGEHRKFDRCLFLCFKLAYFQDETVYTLLIFDGNFKRLLCRFIDQLRLRSDILYIFPQDTR